MRTIFYTFFIAFLLFNTTANAGWLITHNECEWWDDMGNVWENDWKQDFSYDADGNLLSFEDYMWNNDSLRWEGHHKETRQLDANGRSILTTYFNWDYTNQQWVEGSRVAFTYDPLIGHVLEEVNEWWDGTAWELQSKQTHSYDNSTFQRTETITQNHDGSNWVNSSRRTYQYGSMGNLTESIFYTWDDMSSSFTESSRETYAYDASGNQTEYHYFSWDSGSSSWKEFSKTESSYSGGKITERIYHYWDGTALSPNNKTTFAYDGNGNVVEQINYSYDDSTMTWNEAYKTETTYNASNQPIEAVSSSWDGGLGVWLENHKQTFTYDANGNAVSDASYTWNGTEWEESSRCTSTYQEFTGPASISALTIKEEGITVYPNPTTISSTIVLPESKNNYDIQLLDVLGKVIWTETGISEQQFTFSTNELNSGVYLIKVQNDSGEMMTEKLIVK